MNTRLSDEAPSQEALDFMGRRHGLSLLQIAGLFVGALIVALSIAASVNNKIALISILFILLTMVGWYVVVQTQRTRDLVMTTEFQNALFSAALGLNNQFCLIVRHDGAVVYFDRGFQAMFPEFLRQSQRHLALLLEYGKVALQDRESLLAAVGRSSPDRLVFSMEISGKMRKIIINVDPIQRPAGFMLLRGRDFVEQRTSTMPPPVHPTPSQPSPKRPW